MSAFGGPPFPRVVVVVVVVHSVVQRSLAGLIADPLRPARQEGTAQAEEPQGLEETKGHAEGGPEARPKNLPVGTGRPQGRIKRADRPSSNELAGGPEAPQQ